jgi:hypothetical protein
MGVRYIHAYVPLFFEYVKFNLNLNNVTNATVHQCGVFIEEDTYKVAVTDATSGLFTGGT